MGRRPLNICQYLKPSFQKVSLEAVQQEQVVEQENSLKKKLLDQNYKEKQTKITKIVDGNFKITFLCNKRQIFGLFDQFGFV